MLLESLVNCMGCVSDYTVLHVCVCVCACVCVGRIICVFMFVYNYITAVAYPYLSCQCSLIILQTRLQSVIISNRLFLRVYLVPI